MKKNLSLILGMLCLSLLWSESPFVDEKETRAWYFLEHAKIRLEAGEYGTALRFADKAREAYTKKMQHYYKTLEEASSSVAVQDAGDTLRAVYRVLERRQETDACAVIDAILLEYPAERFSHSMSALLAYLKDGRLMPEADYMSGKIYEAEGEYKQAIFYYKRAVKNARFFALPDERFFVLYSLADIYKRRGNFDTYEQYLLLIMSQDALFGSSVEPSHTRKAMMRTIEKEDSIEKFCTLYRHKQGLMLKAYSELMNYYNSAHHPDKAFACGVVAVSIVITDLDSALRNEDFHYKYKNLSDLLRRVGTKPAILHQAQRNNFWDILINFADVLYADGKESQARDLYMKLMQNLPNEEKSRVAAVKLANTL